MQETVKNATHGSPRRATPCFFRRRCTAPGRVRDRWHAKDFFQLQFLMKWVERKPDLLRSAGFLRAAACSFNLMTSVVAECDQPADGGRTFAWGACPAKAGHPATPALPVSCVPEPEDREYWIARSSRAMTQRHGAGDTFHASLSRRFPHQRLAARTGLRISFWMRQLRISATYRTFSDGQAISWTHPNCFSCLPDSPSQPSNLPSSDIL
jgi:hypothetical protein